MMNRTAPGFATSVVLVICGYLPCAVCALNTQSHGFWLGEFSNSLTTFGNYSIRVY